jgi:tetraacyldisaccharide 4'-kinase
MKRPWLAPFVPLYQAGLAWRELRLRRAWEPVRRLQWPVISIGNVSTGGSGKTPLAIALAKLLNARGLHVDVLSRGYGRTNSRPARVDPGGTAEQYGDEPMLIARNAGVPVYVAPQRYDAGFLAEMEINSAGLPDLSQKRITHAHILDDGFQHRQLHRDVDILLLNREDWEDSLLPAGNLREPLRAAERASAIAIPAEDSALESDLRRRGWSGPVWRLHRHMNVPQVDGAIYAFCGIARPDQFFAGLESAGVSIAGQRAFADHYPYSEHVIESITREARLAKARAIMTTDKDAVRLGARASAFPPDLPLLTADLRIEIENPDAAIDWILERLPSPAATSAL